MTYRLRVKRGFATILKNEKEIEPLSGLFTAGSELDELRELVDRANNSGKLSAMQARIEELELLILKNLSPNDCYPEYSPAVQEIKDRLGDK